MTQISKPPDEITDAEQQYNAALRRTRFVVENAFGILKSRFQCLKYIRVRDPKKASSIVSACVILHNLLVASVEEVEELEEDEENEYDLNDNADGGNLRGATTNRERKEGSSHRSRIVSTFAL